MSNINARLLPFVEKRLNLFELAPKGTGKTYVFGNISKFGFLTDAFRFGAPPHGGMGLGLDRLCMIMLKCESLRDVIAFPKMQNARDLMSESPAPCDQQQLDDLGIKFEKE